MVAVQVFPVMQAFVFVLVGIVAGVCRIIPTLPPVQVFPVMVLNVFGSSLLRHLVKMMQYWSARSVGWVMLFPQTVAASAQMMCPFSITFPDRVPNPVAEAFPFSNEFPEAELLPPAESPQFIKVFPDAVELSLREIAVTDTSSDAKKVFPVTDPYPPDDTKVVLVPFFISTVLFANKKVVWLADVYPPPYIKVLMEEDVSDTI